MGLSAWIDHHLETFVRPVLGKVPDLDIAKVNAVWPGQQPYWWTPRKVVALQAVWRQAKTKSRGRPIVLPGRDMYEVSVLAGIEGYPADFRPDLSSSTSSYPKLVGKDYSKHYAIDTGYAGSVPKALKVEAWDLIRWNVLNPTGAGMWLKTPAGAIIILSPYHRALAAKRRDHQLFPHALTGGVLDSLAGTLECSPKYWLRGITNAGGTALVQGPSDPIAFERAAIITRFIAACTPSRGESRPSILHDGRLL